MSDLVDPEAIEKILGVKRHLQAHYGIYVSSEKTFYILHSRICLDSGVDLRECKYSLALDRGIDPFDWDGGEDIPFVIGTWRGHIIPVIPAIGYDKEES